MNTTNTIPTHDYRNLRLYAALALISSLLQFTPLHAETTQPVDISIVGGRHSSISVDAASRLILAWETVATNGRNAIQALRLDGSGGIVGYVATLTSPGNGAYWDPSAAMSENGTIRIDWIASPAPGTCGVITPHRRNWVDTTYDTFPPGAWAVPTCTFANGDVEPSVAISDSGHLIAWSRGPGTGTPDAGLFYLRGGSAVALETCDLTNPPPYCFVTRYQGCAAMRPNGDFAIVWAHPESTVTQDAFFDVRLQQFAADGTAVGNTITVNEPVSLDPTSEESPAIALSSDGELLVTWVSRQPDGCTPSNRFRIYARRLRWNSLGDPIFVAPQFIVDNDSSYLIENAVNANPTVAINTDEAEADRFCIAWEAKTGSTVEVHAQFFGDHGAPLGREFRVHVSTADTNPPGFDPENVRRLANSSAHTLTYDPTGQLACTYTASDISPYVYVTLLPAGYAATLAQQQCTHACDKGDINQDGYVDGRDVQPFVDALLHGPRDSTACSEFVLLYDLCRFDCNEDCQFTTADTANFVCLLLGKPLGCSPYPDPPAGRMIDCNNNGLDDTDDIAQSRSEDCNNSGVPDECELANQDCNGNGYPDDCDIAEARSEDCNGNGFPDECELALGTAYDCQPNGIPDECDIAAATSEDENANNVPDECEGDSLQGGGQQGEDSEAESPPVDAESAFWQWTAEQTWDGMTVRQIMHAMRAKRLELGLPAW